MNYVTSHNLKIPEYTSRVSLLSGSSTSETECSVLPLATHGGGKSRLTGVLNPCGFTLIEIMIVMFIIALLAAIITPRLIGRTDDARVTQARVQIKNFETALKLFKMDNGFYPSTDQGLESLVRIPETGRIPANYRKGGYLEKIAISPDPWGNQYVYISPGTEGDYDIISFGADAEPGGEEYDSDISNWDV